MSLKKNSALRTARGPVPGVMSVPDRSDEQEVQGALAQEVEGTRKVNWERELAYKAAFWLVILFIFMIVLFLQLLAERPAVETLKYEAAKTVLQAAGSVLFGAFVTLAVFLIQKGWEEMRLNIQRQALQEREDLQREADNRRDERHRQDLALRSLLKETIEAYNGVKRIRRIFKARAGSDTIHKEAYESQLLELNELQLTFESFARTVPSLADHRLTGNISHWEDEGYKRMGEIERKAYNVSDLEGLRVDYDGIESYLNKVVGEYESRFHKLPAEGFALKDSTALDHFVNDTESFRNGISRRLRRIQRVLQSALLVPLELPTQKQRP